MRIASLSFCVLLFVSLCLNLADGDSVYSLDAYSNLPYRRMAIPYQRDTLYRACEVMALYAPDMMPIDCTDSTLFATDSLVTAGLLLANSSDPTEQAEGYALLDQVYDYVYGQSAPMLPLNDVWGYDDKVTGRSYALVGACNGVHIVDVTVPLSPVSVFFLPGAFSLWRDIKIFNSTLYAVNDNNWGSMLDTFPNVNQTYIDHWRQDDGLVIIDLSYALQPHFVTKNNEFFQTAHNIQSEHDFSSNDTSAICSWCRPYLYVVGQQVEGWSRNDTRYNGGFIVLDVSDNQNPKKVGEWNETYIHDIVIQYRDGKHIGYGAAIYSVVGVTPGIYIVDVSDPTNPVTLHSFMAHYNGTHNCWPTDDGKYLYVTHEIVHNPITIWNIEDLSNITQVGVLNIVPNNTNMVAHNVHVRGNRLWVSYYSQGSVVYDITDRVHPKLLGQYDTAPDFPAGMDGTWGIYPYADSYNVYATDMSNGLYVLGVKSVQENTGPRGPKGETENTKTFIIISSVLHGVSLLLIVILLVKLLRRSPYEPV